jgi:hypothetical protein
MPKCYACGCSGPTKDFHHDRTRTGDVSSKCKVCMKDTRQARRRRARLRKFKVTLGLAS